jgi:tRNA A-37 threonylcarbamoyl transferase component Bud32
MAYIENDSLKEARVSYPDLIFKSKDVVGEGFYSRVYKATDGGKVYDDRYVTKKFNTNPIITLIMLGKLPQEMFRLEVEALKYLNDYAVVPKIVYFNLKKQYYIIEKLDKVLRIMIIERELTPEHISKFISMIKRLIKTPYRHTDFHNENIMWSNKLEDFRIID